MGQSRCRGALFLPRDLWMIVLTARCAQFLTTFILSLMKSIDIRSESAIKLLAEFLDMDTEYVEGRRYPNAEHFAHGGSPNIFQLYPSTVAHCAKTEVYSYLRSPYKDLFVYDTVAQYDVPPHLPAPPEHERSRRWESPSRPRSRSSPRSRSPRPRSSAHRRSLSRSPSHSRSRSLSWSPSGRHFARPRRSSIHAHSNGRDRSRSGSCIREGPYPRPPKGHEGNTDRTPRADITVGEQSVVSKEATQNRNDDVPKVRLIADDEARRDGTMDTRSVVFCEGKGKQKAQDTEDVRCTSRASTMSAGHVAHPPIFSDSTKQPDSCNISSHQSDSRTDSSERRETRPSRRINLRDSVRAHLAQQLESRPVAKGERKRRIDVITSPLDPVGNKSMHTTEVPSLLARLSDPPEHDAKHEFPDGSAQVIQSNDQAESKPQASAHAQVMTRTRSRLARLEDDVKTTGTTEGRDARPHVVDDDDGQDLRTRLLTRLEGEKLSLSEGSQHLDAIAPMPIGASSPTRGPLRDRVAPSSASADAHAQTVEASLRRRAQLRARLAAAKRNL